MKLLVFILQDEIVPFFEVIMTPLKQFLVYDKNPDSFVIFNQTLDTLAYLARAAGPSGFSFTEVLKWRDVL